MKHHEGVRSLASPRLQAAPEKWLSDTDGGFNYSMVRVIKLQSGARVNIGQSMILISNPVFHSWVLISKVRLHLTFIFYLVFRHTILERRTELATIVHTLKAAV